MSKEETIQVITLLAGNYDSIAKKDKIQKIPLVKMVYEKIPKIPIMIMNMIMNMIMI